MRLHNDQCGDSAVIIKMPLPESLITDDALTRAITNRAGSRGLIKARVIGLIGAISPGISNSYCFLMVYSRHSYTSFDTNFSVKLGPHINVTMGTSFQHLRTAEVRIS